MFSKIKSLFSNQPNPEVPLNHPKVSDPNMQQCPFMANKNNQTKNHQANPQNSDSSSEEDEKPRGGCPFMATSGKKKNPNLGIAHECFDEPYVSKFKFYLSENKLNLEALKKGAVQKKIKRNIFNQYPIYLQHTLLYNGQDYKKVRGFECCSRFLAYEQLREKGNKYFNKGKYRKALDHYERAMSLFRWLEHKQEETEIKTTTQLSFEQGASKSQISESEQQMGSKIHLNMNESMKDLMKPSEEKEKQFDDLSKKYKQFFVIYHDDNVEYFEGEDMVEKPDIDMKNSLLIQIYLNMAAAFIKLNNLSLARQIIQDGFKLSDQVSQLYLRKAQAILSDNGATLELLHEAEAAIKMALSMMPNEKIFMNTNKNILKMINIHDAEEVYNDVFQKVEAKKKTLKETINTKQQAIENRLASINRAQKQIIEEGKTPREGRQKKLLSKSEEFKIIQRMYSKYIRILEFYTQAKNDEQIMLGKNQFQQILRIVSEVKMIEGIQIEKNDEKFGANKEKVFQRIVNIKRQHCEDLYNQGKYNFHVLEWAIKQIVKEEKQEEQRKQQESKINNSSSQSSQAEQFISGKSNFIQKLPYAMVFVPIVALFVNYFLW